MIDNYKKLSLDKYLQLREINTTQEDIDIQVEIIAILSDESVDDILNLPIAEYKSRAAKTVFLSEQPKTNINPPKTVKINGREYRVMQSAKDFTTAQYIDYQGLIKEPDKVEKNLLRLMTIFLIPKGAKAYNDGYDLEVVMEDSKALSVEIVLGLARFFFRQSQKSINNTLTYLDWMVKRMKKKEKRTEVLTKMETAQKSLHTLKSLLQNGDGLIG